MRSSVQRSTKITAKHAAVMPSAARSPMTAFDATTVRLKAA